MPLSRDRIDKTDPTSHLRLEWLLTNRPGSYAIGTAVGMNTHRYHELLVAAVAPPVRRVIVVSSMIEQLVINEQTIELSTFPFPDPDLLHPEGWRHLTRFQTTTTRLAPWTSCGDRFEVSGTLHLVEAGMVDR